MARTGDILGLSYNGNSAAAAEPDFQERGIDTTGFIGPTQIPSQPVPAPEPSEAKKQQVGLAVDESVRGLSGTANLMGFIEDVGEYDSKLLGLEGIKAYQKMRRSDPICAALELARTLPIRAADWQIVEGAEANEPGRALAKEMAAKARENFFGGLERETASGEKRTQTLESVIENALLCILGVSGHEDIWEVDKDKGCVRLARMSPRLPDTFFQFTTEPDGETLYELIQFGFRGPQVLLLPVKATKLALFVMNREGANFYGRSIFRPCYLPWYFKQHLMRIEAVALERNGMGIPWIQLGPNASDKDKQAAWQYAGNLSVNERSALVTPNGYLAEMMAVKGKVLSPRAAIQYYDLQMMNSGLAAWLLLGQSSTGTRNVGSVQKDFYLLAEESLANLIAETITSTSLKRLIDHNYEAKPSERLPYPKLVCSDIRMVELETVLNAVKELANQGVDMLRPSIERDNAVAEMIGLPKLKEKQRGPRLAPVMTRQNLTDEVVSGTGEKIAGGGSKETPKGGGKRGEVESENPGKLQSGARPKDSSPMPTSENKTTEQPVKDAAEFSEATKGGEDTPPTTYFMRHAHTALNKDGDPAEEKLKGQTDVPPDAKGLEQAEHDAEQFRGSQISAIYSSPLLRSMALAKAIGKATGADVHEDPDLLPWNYHKLVGMTRKAAAPKFAEAEKRPDEEVIGESRNHYLGRWKRGAQRAIQHTRETGKSAVVVTHSPNLKDLDYAVGEGEGERKVPETGGAVKVQLAESGRQKAAKAPPSTASPFWRPGHNPALKMVYPHETHVDYPGHEGALDLAEMRIARLLRARRGKLLRKMAAIKAQALKSGKVRETTDLVGSGGLSQEIAPLLSKLYYRARREVQEEHERLGARPYGREMLAEKLPAEDPSELIAEIAAQRYAQELANGVSRAAANVQSQPDVKVADLDANDLGDLIFDNIAGVWRPGIPAVSDKLEENIAAMAARSAWRRGRSDEAQQIVEALERIGVKSHWIRRAILDKNVCEPCEAKDGQPWPPEVPVSSICEGGDLCRCEEIELRS